MKRHEKRRLPSSSRDKRKSFASYQKTAALLRAEGVGSPPIIRVTMKESAKGTGNALLLGIIATGSMKQAVSMSTSGKERDEVPTTVGDTKDIIETSETRIGREIIEVREAMSMSAAVREGIRVDGNGKILPHVTSEGDRTWMLIRLTPVKLRLGYDISKRMRGRMKGLPSVQKERIHRKRGRFSQCMSYVSTIRGSALLLLSIQVLIFCSNENLS